MPASEPAPPGSGVAGRGHWALMSVVAGLIHAALMAAAFPSFNLWPCVLLAPAPLVWLAIHLADRTPPGPRRWRRALGIMLLVAAGVLPFDLYEQRWLIDVTAPGYGPLAVAMALFPGAFVVLLGRMRRALPWLPVSLGAPVLWTGLEVLRGEVAFTGYPWYLLAHPLIASPLLAMPAAIVGTYGVSFLVVVPSGVAADVLGARRRWIAPAVLGLGSVALVVVAPWLTPSAGPGGIFRVAVVQTNIPQDNKLDWMLEQKTNDFERFLELTRRAAAADPRPDVIVWPETMFPGMYLDPDAVAQERRFGVYRRADKRPTTDLFHDRLLAFQAEIGIPMLVGAIGADNVRVHEGDSLPLPDAVYNSVFVIQHGQVQSTRYDKIGLTPFGVVLPYASAWPWLERQIMAFGARGMTFELTAGTTPRVFRIPSRLPDRAEVVIATPICFEATKAGLCRRLLAGYEGMPRIVINLTNDGWFGSFDAGRWQHLQSARWRAVE